MALWAGKSDLLSTSVKMRKYHRWLVYMLVVDTMSKACPLLTIGPTIPSIYLNERIKDEDDYGISLCEIDESLSINWLSTKPTGSVLYVSFWQLRYSKQRANGRDCTGFKEVQFSLLVGGGGFLLKFLDSKSAGDRTSQLKNEDDES